MYLHWQVQKTWNWTSLNKETRVNDKINSSNWLWTHLSALLCADCNSNEFTLLNAPVWSSWYINCSQGLLKGWTCPWLFLFYDFREGIYMGIVGSFTVVYHAHWGACKLNRDFNSWVRPWMGTLVISQLLTDQFLSLTLLITSHKLNCISSNITT